MALYYGTISENEMRNKLSSMFIQPLSPNDGRTIHISREPRHVGWIYAIQQKRRTKHNLVVQFNTLPDGITTLAGHEEHRCLSAEEAIKLADKYFDRTVVLDNPMGIGLGYRILARVPQGVMQAAKQVRRLRHRSLGIEKALDNGMPQE